MGFPGGTVGKEPACQCRRHKRGGAMVQSWVRNVPWRRKWQPTPVFLPGESRDRGAWRAAVHGVTLVCTHICTHTHTHTHTHTLLLMVEAAVMVGNAAVSHLRPHLINEFVWIPSQS